MFPSCPAHQHIASVDVVNGLRRKRGGLAWSTDRMRCRISLRDHPMGHDRLRQAGKKVPCLGNPSAATPRIARPYPNPDAIRAAFLGSPTLLPKRRQGTVAVRAGFTFKAREGMRCALAKGDLRRALDAAAVPT